MKERPLTIASIGAALAASSCCIGPLVAVVLGLGSFGAGSLFETLRPVLLALSGLFLAGAFFLSYRRVPAGTGECCSPAARTRIRRAPLWLATGLVVLFGTFPYYSSFVWAIVREVRPPAGQSPDGQAKAAGAESESEKLEEVEIEVRGMT